MPKETQLGPQGVQGPQGPQGIQGYQGEKGDKGDKGEQGERGFRGDNGYRGERGEQGIKGDRGPKGEQGEKGERGERGEQGKQGLKGLKGERGLKGDKGEQGDKGDKGEKGEKGEQGSMMREKNLSEKSTDDTRVNELLSCSVNIPKETALTIIFNSRIISKDENNAGYIGLDINGIRILEPIQIIPGVIKIFINSRRPGYLVGEIKGFGFSQTFDLLDVADIKLITIVGRVDYGLTKLFVSDLIIYSDPV
jgi:Collagen triple helix repeat (20 copies)